MPWTTTKYSDPRVQQLISRHYCRKNPSAFYNRVGYSMVLHLAHETGEAVYIWWRPKWESGLPHAQRFDGLKAIECVIFRNETKLLSSDLIRSATEQVLAWEHAKDVEWPDGLLTSVNSKKTAARRGKKNPPGYCYLKAGWSPIPGKRTTNTDAWLHWDGPTASDDNVARWLEDRRKLGFGNRGAGVAKQIEIKQHVGRRYEKLVVLSYESLKPRPDGIGADLIWKCRCDCGREVSVRQSFLRIGDVKNCGRCEQVDRVWSEMFLRRLALSIEFEGTFGVYEGTGPRATIGVRNYSDELVRGMQRTYGTGDVTVTVHEEGLTAQWQNGGGDAVALAKSVLPFMVCKREQAEMVAGYDLGRRGTKVSASARTERERLWALTQVLNARGPQETKPEWAQLAAKWHEWIAGASTEARAELLAWAIEWEGFIGVYERVHSETISGRTHQVVVGISQVSHRRCLLEIVQALAGGRGGISAPHQNPKHPGWAPCCSWRVNAAGEAADLARELIPFLRYKKRLTELVLAFPTASFDERRLLAEETKRINAGSPVEVQDNPGLDPGALVLDPDAPVLNAD